MKNNINNKTLEQRIDYQRINEIMLTTLISGMTMFCRLTAPPPPLPPLQYLDDVLKSLVL